jgi:hypothetical protein
LFGKVKRFTWHFIDLDQVYYLYRSAQYKSDENDSTLLVQPEDYEMIKTIKYQVKNELNNPLIISHLQSVDHPKKYENADEMLRIDEDRLKDWRSNIAIIRAQ